MPPTEVPSEGLAPAHDLLPGNELVWPVVAVIAVALAVVALVHVGRERQKLGPLAVLWVVIVVAAPVVGPLLYLFTRRRVRLVPLEAGPATTAPESP
ncbi:PLDc N-terminal domain-containing protein [Georgenia subflava]|uniref:Cardiolipin synthase N-terminal domain-containing protein n=1 Tax=Georgenia subflava TaxID=1622177 RepID=A0A6N7EL12_9MICO|nr:PLDc N-terminal domain-containing protein [Georgenia subflava]MPV37245.1 hypothetical protein [Georgenia subflava]